MSREPTRLLEQGDLSLGERALLEAARQGEPCAYDVDAGAGRFRASLAALAAAGAVATAHGASRGSALVGGKTLLANVVVKVILGVAAGSALFTGGLVIGTRMAARTQAPVAASMGPSAATPAPPPPPPVHPEKTGAPAPEAVVEPPPAALAAPAPARKAAEHPTTAVVASRTSGVETQAGSARGPATDEISRAQAPPARTAEAPAASPPPAPSQSAAPVEATPRPPEASDSLSELRALAVTRNLVDRDPEAALTALDRMRRDYPHGYFVEERQALTVLALAGAGHTSAAHQQATSFLRLYPNGPFSDRVRAVLPN
jgi:hypothetical protein